MSNNVTLKNFPSGRFDFQEDLSPIVSEVIDRYGMIEWRAVVLTLEMHRHLGLYAIIGAKMGVRAVEILGGDHHNLQVVSYAGQTPPMSCMNDGLQVATGASLGHGNIEIAPLAEPMPRALFKLGGRRLSLELDPRLQSKINQALNNIANSYGFATKEYWQAVRTLAIGYWRDLDRRDMFTLPTK